MASTANDSEQESMMESTFTGRRRTAMSIARCARRLALGAAACAAVAVAAPATAGADPAQFGFQSLTTSVIGTHDAGGHPDVNTAFVMKSDGGVPHGTTKQVEVDLPVGLVGDPTGIPRCSRQQFFSPFSCPANTQVGETSLVFTTAGDVPGSPGEHAYPNRPVYNLEPDANQPALFGIGIQPVLGLFAYIKIEVRPDGGLRAIVPNIPLATPLRDSDLTFWGVPADRNPANPTPGVSTPEWPRVPFMTAPTECSTLPRTVVRVRSYEGYSDRAVSVEPNRAENCDSVPFDPSVVVRSEQRTAGSPTALTVDIMIPQNRDPDGQAAGHLRDVTMVLPEGVNINPGTARDLTACSNAAFGKDREGPATCPAGSKVGTIGIHTPLLAEPMPGDIYIGEPRPGERFRLFLYAASRGVHIKIAGVAIPDPKTGQVTAVFHDNPQMPFNRMHLRFRGGNNAVLSLPTTCGPKSAVAGMSSWTGASRQVGDVFQVYADEAGSPCPETQPFGATFVAGTTNAHAGADTGLTLTFGRGDQDQYLGGLRMHLPTGLVGRLTAMPQCSVAAAENNACSDDSLVGGAAISAGAGQSLLNLPGRVYLIEPYKPGQLVGLAIVVRAIAGPYDLGTVVVKTGITVNPDTSLSVESDPLPILLEGVALRLRQVTINVDRPGFMINPTDCSPKQITGSVLSSTGTVAEVSSPFRATGCAALPFDPPMSITATRPDTKTNDAIGLQVKLGGLPGHANARQVQVVLPRGIGARLQGPIQTPCTGEQFARDECSNEARVGSAIARTPILPTLLEGNAYFLENPGGGLPRLAVRLKGAVQIDLVADITLTPGGRVTTTFPAVPDVPIEEFNLSLDGGSRAILSAGEICDGRQLANRALIAHSGKVQEGSVKVTVSGCTTSAASKAKKRKGASRRAKHTAKHASGRHHQGGSRSTRR